MDQKKNNAKWWVYLILILMLVWWWFFQWIWPKLVEWWREKKRAETAARIDASEEMKKAKDWYASQGWDASNLNGEYYCSVAESIAWCLGTDKKFSWWQKLWIDHGQLVDILARLHTYEEYVMVAEWYNQISAYGDLGSDLMVYMKPSDYNRIWDKLNGMVKIPGVTPTLPTKTPN